MRPLTRQSVGASADTVDDFADVQREGLRRLDFTVERLLRRPDKSPASALLILMMAVEVEHQAPVLRFSHRLCLASCRGGRIFDCGMCHVGSERQEGQSVTGRLGRESNFEVVVELPDEFFC